MQKSVLGRGLSALISTSPVEPKTRIVNIAIAEISLSKVQPRQVVSAPRLAELAASIKEKGVIQPVLVRPRKEGGYELIAGERRLRAAKNLGISQLPAIIKDVDDEQALHLSLIENIQREELNCLEEAQAYQRLIKRFGYTQEKVAKAVGKDPSSVSNYLRLLKLPQEIQTALGKGLITMGHARTILGVTSLDEQGNIFKRTINQRLSVRQLESLITKRRNGARLRRKRIGIGDSHLVAMEEGLQRLFGTKVKIVVGRKRGKIVLEYYSQEDLGRILKLLKSVK